MYSTEARSKGRRPRPIKNTEAILRRLSLSSPLAAMLQGTQSESFFYTFVRGYTSIDNSSTIRNSDVYDIIVGKKLLTWN